MISHTSYQLALRTRLLTLSVCTSGLTTLTPTATGYVRAAGSFLDDGFAVGLEIQPSRFKDNTPDTIVSVVEKEIITQNGRTAEKATLGSLTVGLPSLRSWENVAFNPQSNHPYIDEQYLHGPAAIQHDGSVGLFELTPMYVITVYVPSNAGMLASGRYGDALLSLFAPDTVMRLANGDLVRVRADVAPAPTQRRQTDPPNWSAMPVKIPLRVLTMQFPS